MHQNIKCTRVSRGKEKQKRTEPWDPVSDSASSNRLRCVRREELGLGTPGSGPPGTLGSPSTSRTPSGIAATRLRFPQSGSVPLVVLSRLSHPELSDALLIGTGRLTGWRRCGRLGADRCAWGRRYCCAMAAHAEVHSQRCCRPRTAGCRRWGRRRRRPRGGGAAGWRRWWRGCGRRCGWRRCHCCGATALSRRPPTLLCAQTHGESRSQGYVVTQ